MLRLRSAKPAAATFDRWMAYCSRCFNSKAKRDHCCGFPAQPKGREPGAIYRCLCEYCVAREIVRSEYGAPHATGELWYEIDVMIDSFLITKVQPDPDLLKAMKELGNVSHRYEPQHSLLIETLNAVLAGKIGVRGERFVSAITWTPKEHRFWPLGAILRSEIKASMRNPGAWYREMLSRWPEPRPYDAAAYHPPGTRTMIDIKACRHCGEIGDEEMLYAHMRVCKVLIERKRREDLMGGR